MVRIMTTAIRGGDDNDDRGDRDDKDYMEYNVNNSKPKEDNCGIGENIDRKERTAWMT